MIRIREIIDPELRAQIIAMLADSRGMSPSMVPEWFELDDADYSEMLIELHARDRGGERGDLAD